MNQVSVEEFRATMGDYLDRIYYRHEKFVVTRNGTPFVTVTPVLPGTNLERTEQTKAKDFRIRTSEVLGSVHFQEKELLIMRRGKPTALVSSLRQTAPGVTL